MAKADVLALVTSFSNGQADSTLADLYYDNDQSDLARHPWLVGAHLVSVAAGTGEFTLAVDESKLVQVFYDTKVLDRTTERALEQRNPQWRDEVGTPIAYMIEDEPAQTYRLYPIPQVPSQPFSFIFGEPMGRDFPLYSAAIFVTEVRTDVPEWMEMALAWRVLAREYGHESNHRDDDFAAFAQQLSEVMFAM